MYFRGSFATGSQDEYNDVDLRADTHRKLDARFWTALEEHLTVLYGPASIRYDPASRETTFQHLRFSFHDLPIFWRLDLDVSSDQDLDEKFPSRMPEWAIGTSALMNVVWAIKYHRRGNDERADHYLACACDKLGKEMMGYSTRNILNVLNRLGTREDVDTVLLEKTREAVEEQTRVDR